MRGSSSDPQNVGLVDLCKQINTHFHDSNEITLVEIGVYSGESTMIFEANLNNSKIICVDPWETYREDNSTYDLNNQHFELIEAENKFDERTKDNKNIKKVKMKSLDYASTLPDNCIDAVYIDGNHSYSFVLNDILVWNKKVKQGGLICGHDYSWDGVKRALNETMNRTPDKVFQDGSWLYSKTSK